MSSTTVTPMSSNTVSGIIEIVLTARLLQE
jgi:hypothetical protein